MNHRRGFTLVEMMASISVGSVLMVLAMGVVHRTMRIESAARKNDRAERTAVRLSRQFRHDIHRAQSVSLDTNQNDAAVLRVTLPNQAVVTYRMESHRVIRQQPRQNDQTYREQFTFPDTYQTKFTELTAPPRAVLTITSDTGLVGVAPRVELHVEAVVSSLLHRRVPLPGLSSSG